jgi:catechol 2,3-dioxygenase-like lactoylglutathione lyase family enzyme
MDYDTIPAADFGQSLTGLSVNLLVRDVQAEVAFLTGVFGLAAHQVSDDFAILVHAGQPFQLHSDRTFARHPLYALLPESGPRGAGIELRLPGCDPDQAVARLAGFAEAVLLAGAQDKTGHGLREAVILCPNGYAWVPSRSL